MIINIRGTHGSGKSTIMSTILKNYPNEPESVDKRGRPENYKVNIPFIDKPVYIIGSYENACGGCDGIQPYSEIWPRIVRLADLGHGHILFEGALVSSSYGNIGKASEIYGDDFVFAFMDTPVEECLRRIQARRLAKGNTKPLDPKNTVSKHNNVERSITKIREVYQRRVVILDHRKALSQVLGLLNHAS
jgi:hypothetical protein